MIRSSGSEEILNWQSEAEAIIRDVKDHVKFIGVSTVLPSNIQEIFLNLKTIENKEFCIRASGNGFQIVSEEFDRIWGEAALKRIQDQLADVENQTFETPYALLNRISPSYIESFANRLSSQLESLQNEVESDN